MHKLTTALAVAALGIAAAARSLPAWPQTIVHASLEKHGKMPRLSACPARFDDSLSTNGIAPIGIVPGVNQPRAVWAPEAAFTDKARKEIHKRAMFPFRSVSTIAVVVDPNGVPRDLCVQKSAEFDLDKAAAESVWEYRFQPATKDGKPVAKRLSVEVKFLMN
ncbi:hypothetical protein DYQ86_10285 [Acidobacteria bacterium AB60]|nr:hypothetical protein DYQ86_10285 [Acidobacteria bacterium AB60]